MALLREIRRFFYKVQNFHPGVSLKAIDVDPPQRSHTYSEKQYETQRLVSIFHAAGPSLARWVRRRKKKQKVAGRGERTREAQLLLLLLCRSSCWEDVLMLQLSRGAGAARCHGPQHPTHPPSERLLAPVTSTKSGPRQQRPGASASAAAAASASPPPPPPPPVTCLRLPGQGDFVPS